MKFRSFISLAICFLAIRGFAEDRTVLPGDPAIRYVGRFTDDFQFGWTGCTIETEFEGESVSAILELTEGRNAGVAVVIDGVERYISVEPGRTVYPLAEGLVPAQKHRVVLFKRSEGKTGTIRFKGFIASSAAGFSRPNPRSRKMLAIGDSITCGYGNEASSVEEGNTVENENGFLSHAAIAARSLDADLMMVCWSGRGMFRNLSAKNDRRDTLPDLFRQTLPLDKEAMWDHSRFVPDVIVINLGTNDMGTRGGKEPLRREDYVGAYVNFIKQLRAFAPEAAVILGMGPMLYEPVSTWLPGIADQFKNISVLIYAPYADPSEIGGHRHPSVKKHVEMAGFLEQRIREMTSWQ